MTQTASATTSSNATVASKPMETTNSNINVNGVNNSNQLDTLTALFERVFSAPAATNTASTPTNPNPASSLTSVDEEGDVWMCYGLGSSVPKVPFLFQGQPGGSQYGYNFLHLLGMDVSTDQTGVAVEEDDKRREAMKSLIEDFVNEYITKEGHKYHCQLDGHQFTSENNAIMHMRQAHHSTIEEMLHVLAADDTEQVHMGQFFTKLFYSDFLYPTLQRKPSPSSEFPSVVAPYLEDLQKIQHGNKLKKKKKDNKDLHKEFLDTTNFLRRDRKILGARSIFSDDELSIMEIKIFGEPSRVKKEKQPIAERTVKEKSPDIPTEQENIPKIAVQPQAKPKAIPASVTKEVVPAPTKEDPVKLNKKAEPALKIDRKMKKQLEEDISNDVIGEVLYGLCSKLAIRTMQEMKKKDAKDKEEAEQKVKAEEEAQREVQLVAEKERRLQERKTRRELRKQESEKLTEDLTEELISLECESLALEVFQEYIIAPQKEIPVTKPIEPVVTPKFTPPPTNYPPYVNPVTQMQQIPTSYSIPNDARYYHPVPHVVQSIPAYMPLMGSPNIRGVPQYEDYRPQSSYEHQYQHRSPSPYTQPQKYATTLTQEVFTEPATIPTPPPSNRKPPTVEPTLAPAAISTPPPAPTAIPSPTSTKHLRSFPEDYGMDSSRCVVCTNLGNVKKGEITAFFKECTISIGYDYSSKIQFLKGVDQGCCFVEFETQADVDKAMTKNGLKLGDNIIEVDRPPGILKTESGQRFALSASTRNINGPTNDLPLPSKPGELQAASQAHSLSTMLNTENDTIVSPISKNITKSFLPVGRKAQPNIGAAFPPPTPMSNERISAAFGQSLFGTSMPIDNTNMLHSQQYGLFDYNSDFVDINESQFKLDMLNDEAPQHMVDPAEEAFMDRFLSK